MQLTQQMSTMTTIDVSVTGEGPCAYDLGLYDILDRLTAELGFKKNNIKLHTANLLERHDEYNIIIEPTMRYLDDTKKLLQNFNSEKKFDQSFKHFGNFIGHGNLYRLQTASYLYKHHRAQTLQSYSYNRHSDYHRPFIGIEGLMCQDVPESVIDIAYDFLKKTPLIIDPVAKDPIPYDDIYGIATMYSDFFVEIVNLAYFSGNTFYVDEKIWKPIILQTPFMVQGSQNYIKNLRKLGFQTFDRWWDEGYSEDPANCQTQQIMQNIDRLSKLGTTDLKIMYQEMIPILEHNYQTLFKLTTEDFLNKHFESINFV